MRYVGLRDTRGRCVGVTGPSTMLAGDSKGLGLGKDSLGRGTAARRPRLLGSHRAGRVTAEDVD